MVSRAFFIVLTAFAVELLTPATSAPILRYRYYHPLAEHDDLSVSTTSSLIWVSARKILNNDEFVSIQLKCPSSNRLTLEHVARNINGQMERIRLLYSNGKPARIEVSTAEKNSNLEDFLVVDLSSKNTNGSVAAFKMGWSNKDMYEIGLLFLERAEKMYATLCLGTARQQDSFLADVAFNKNKLHIPLSEYPSSFGN